MSNNIWLVQALDPADAVRLASAGILTNISVGEQDLPCADMQDTVCEDDPLTLSSHCSAADDANEPGAQASMALANEDEMPCTKTAPRDTFETELDEPDWGEMAARAREGALDLETGEPLDTSAVQAADAPAAEQARIAVVEQAPASAPQALAAEPQIPAPQTPVPRVSSMAQPAQAEPEPAAPQRKLAWSAGAKLAPVVTAISGRGGVGKSTLVAAMAAGSALLGLRTAVIDLDLMFGDLYSLFGADLPADIVELSSACKKGFYNEDELVRAGVRIGPGLTLWGPIAQAEQAELMGDAVELLIETLRHESDVVFIDTSTFWGDAVAAAVGASSRCLIVGDQKTMSVASAARVIDLAARLGVPRTSMTAVLNRFGARGCDEEYALRYELTCALGSKVRIADGGSDTESLLSYGHASDLVLQNTPFAKDVRAFTHSMLVELGCTPGTWPQLVDMSAKRGDRARIRLPWTRQEAA